MTRYGLYAHHRIKLLGWVLFAVMMIIVARLFYMQVLQHQKYVTLAVDEQVKSLVIPASRGELYAIDENKPVKLVLNETVYTVFVDPLEVKEPQAIVDAVRQIAGGTMRPNSETLVRKKPSRYQIVATQVTRKQAELLKAKKLAGLGMQKTSRRVYPEGQMAAQVLGFVNAEGNGQYGIEEKMDAQLRGKNGMLRSVTDVNQVPLTIGDHNVRRPAVNGKNIVLSIDRNIQSYTEIALESAMQKNSIKYGSALVMDPQTGRVLAMANFPTYNPQEFTKVMDGAAFNNGTITEPYEPGSVMKTFTVATALDKGVIEPSTTYVNTDKIQVEDRVITNASKGQTGTITMQHALNWSLNTGMVTVAQRLGDGKTITKAARTTMYDYFHNKFGLGEKTNIELAGEQAGELISPDNVEGNAVRYSNMSFGQGMDPTMVQVSAGFSSIVNGGKYYAPTVINGTIRDDGTYDPLPTPQPLRQTISPEASAKVKQMIRGARQAFYSKNDKKGYDIGGKTGTSQTIVNGEYNFDQTLGTYIGYGGDTEARYVIMVRVASPGRALAGTDAVPIFTDISNWMIDYKQLAPKG